MYATSLSSTPVHTQQCRVRPMLHFKQITCVANGKSQDLAPIGPGSMAAMLPAGDALVAGKLKL